MTKWKKRYFFRMIVGTVLVIGMFATKNNPTASKHVFSVLFAVWILASLFLSKGERT